MVSMCNSKSASKKSNDTKGKQIVAKPLSPEQLKEMLDKSTSLGSQLATLSNSWRDQENRKFCEDFEQHMRLLARFIEANNDHIPYLMRKADRIEEYLQQR